MCRDAVNGQWVWHDDALSILHTLNINGSWGRHNECFLVKYSRNLTEI